MPAFHIDKQTGVIHLPSGLAIGPDLTRDALRAGRWAEAVRSEDRGAAPWIHDRVSGGQLEGHELLVSLSFHKEALLAVSITANLYPPGPPDWSNYSLDVEAATKALHDRLVEQSLGRPSQGGSFLLGRLPAAKETLQRPLTWTLPWGTVDSSHDVRSGGTSITVRYADRQES